MNLVEIIQPEAFGRARISDMLLDLEKQIAEGLSGFERAGAALKQIREGRLYQKSHDTFEDYCKARWGFTRQRASQLIIAAEIVRKLPCEMSTKIDKPAIALALSKVDPARQADVLEKSLRSPKPLTAKLIKESAETFEQWAARRAAEELRADKKFVKQAGIVPDIEMRVTLWIRNFYGNFAVCERDGAARSIQNWLQKGMRDGWEAAQP